MYRIYTSRNDSINPTDRGERMIRNGLIRGSTTATALETYPELYPADKECRG